LSKPTFVFGIYRCSAYAGSIWDIGTLFKVQFRHVY